MAGYEQIRVADELSESVQRAARIAPRRHEALGELVRTSRCIEKRSGLKTSSRRSRLVTRLG
jgi:hypothetical protein